MKEEQWVFYHKAYQQRMPGVSGCLFMSMVLNWRREKTDSVKVNEQQSSKYEVAPRILRSLIKILGSSGGVVLLNPCHKKPRNDP